VNLTQTSERSFTAKFKRLFRPGRRGPIPVQELNPSFPPTSEEPALNSTVGNSIPSTHSTQPPASNPLAPTPDTDPSTQTSVNDPSIQTLNNPSTQTSLTNPSLLASRVSAISITAPLALGTCDEIEAKLVDSLLLARDANATATHSYKGKIALRVQRDGLQYLTLSTHVLNDAFKMRPIFGNAKIPGGSVDDLKRGLVISVGKQKVSTSDTAIENDCSWQQVGEVSEIFDDDPSNYPGGYRGDISLIKLRDEVNIQNIKTPDVRWITDDEWRTLQSGQIEIELQGPDNRNAPANPVRRIGERTGRVCKPFPQRPQSH
jgi:hypothetical protein